MKVKEEELKKEDGTAIRHSISQRLTNPDLHLSLEDALKLWRWAEIEVQIKTPYGLENIPDLPHRIRGAWGRILEKIHLLEKQKQNVPNFSKDYSWDFFMEKPYNVSPLSSTRPYLIQVDKTAKILIVKLIIMGMALSFLETAQNAFLESFKKGIAIKHLSKHRIPLEVLSYKTEWYRGINYFDAADSVKLKILTPIQIRKDKALAGDLSSLPINLWNRCRSLALWQDISIKKYKNIKELSLSYDYRENIYSTAWQRHSASASHVLNGYLGEIEIEGNISPLLPLLAFGEKFHAGSSCSLGMGRYQLLVY